VASVLRTDALDYELPPGRIATRPAEPRDSAKLLVIERGQIERGFSARREDRHIRDLPGLLRLGDLLVVNSSRVIPARITGTRLGTGGRIEGLFVSERDGDGGGGGGEGGAAGVGCPSRQWTVLLKGGHLRPGILLRLDTPINAQSESFQPTSGENLGRVILELVERSPIVAGAWTVGVRVESDDRTPLPSTSAILDCFGRMPLPPYILKARASIGQTVDDLEDRAWYQTSYAGESGSVAAPTAGLHFTPGLLDALESAGIGCARVVLHVGLGTFKPVEAEHIEEHPMHTEWCQLPHSTRKAIDQAKARGGRVIAVGTTAARTLESLWASTKSDGPVETSLLITPGYRWTCVDGLLTNFHLPRSTLLAMVAALLGRDASAAGALLAHYAHALAKGYRFFSYGDAMLVLPPGQANG
jgi:S-adenosylmethionine:tRNA ribosyltransferase-isomerase